MMINKKNNGFTLIEVILSIAILGILAVTFMPILSNQYISIVGTGKKSESTYLAVDEIEEKIIGKDYSKDTPTKTLKIEFNNPKKIMDIDVDYIEAYLTDESEAPEKPNDEKNKIVVGIPKP